MNPLLIPTVICPGCHAELDVKHAICPRCRASLTATREIGTASPSQSGEPDSVLDRPWVIAILLLHVGFLGIPLYWKTRYSSLTRLILCIVSVFYTVLACAFIVVVGAWLWTELGGR